MLVWQAYTLGDMAPALIARALEISSGIADSSEIRMSVLSVLLGKDKLENKLEGSMKCVSFSKMCQSVREQLNRLI